MSGGDVLDGAAPRTGSLLARVLAETGFLMEPGASGSLHVTMSDAIIRAALRKPLPADTTPNPLMEPLWDSDTGALLLHF